VRARLSDEERGLSRDWQVIVEELGGTTTALRSKFSRAANRVMTELVLGKWFAQR
jgi:hypothetical protein